MNAAAAVVRPSIAPGDFVVRRDRTEKAWRGVVLRIEGDTAIVDAVDTAAGYGDHRPIAVDIALIERAALRAPIGGSA